MHHRFKRRPSAILDFTNSKCYPHVELIGSKCVTIPGFIKIDQTVAETRCFKMAAVCHVRFLTVSIGSLGQCASLC